MPSITNTATISAYINRLSAAHRVEPLAVVGLLAVHALVELDFPKLGVWKDVAAAMHGAVAA